MACLTEKKIEDIAVGGPVGIAVEPEDRAGNYAPWVNWGVKLEQKEGCPYNVALESGHLVLLAPGTVVLSGYGFGNR